MYLDRIKVHGFMIALLSEGLGKCRVQEKVKIQNEDLRTVTYLHTYSTWA